MVLRSVELATEPGGYCAGSRTAASVKPRRSDDDGDIECRLKPRLPSGTFDQFQNSIRKRSLEGAGPLDRS